MILSSALETGESIFAAYAHRDQKRKYTGEPYINHPMAVADIVRSVPHTEEMLAASWLHDTLEDTSVTFLQLEELFGRPVALLVLDITDVSRPSDGNRKRRKEKDRYHLATASPEAKTIKLADLIDNSSSIIERDPEFARVYLEEKRALLEVLKDGDPTLWARADKIAREARP